MTVRNMDAAFASDMTESAVEQANTLLQQIKQDADPHWKKVLQTVLGEAEFDLNIVNVNGALELMGLDAPIGAIVGGTGSLKAAAGLTGEDSQRAIRILKRSGRLLQAGKGRGKALVLISDKPIEMATEKPVARKAVRVGAAAADGGAPHDVPTLLKMARDSHRELQMRYDDAANRIRALEGELAKLQEQLEGRQKAALQTWQ